MTCCNGNSKKSSSYKGALRASDLLSNTSDVTAPKGIHNIGIKKAIEGSVNIGKTVAGLDLVDNQEAVRRLEICAKCQYRQIDQLGLMKWWSCTQCGCILKFKVMSMSQSCPKDKW